MGSVQSIGNQMYTPIPADLHTLKGLSPVVNLLRQSSPNLQAGAAYVLGTAASNNNKFHDMLMQYHPESIGLLMLVGPCLLSAVLMAFLLQIEPSRLHLHCTISDSCHLAKVKTIAQQHLHSALHVTIPTLALSITCQTGQHCSPARNPSSTVMIMIVILILIK